MGISVFYGRENTPYRQVFLENLYQALDESPDGHVIYLVLPEQATFHFEQLIEETRGNHNLWNLEITSFQKLCRKYIKETSLNELGRELLCYQALTDVGSELESVHFKRISPGFISEFCEVIKECSLYGIDSQELRSLIENEDNVITEDVADKIKDLALIIDKVYEYGFKDDNVLIRKLAELIKTGGSFCENASFFFGGFEDFSAAESEVIQALTALHVNLVFSFCTERHNPLFYRTNHIINQLENAACKEKLAFKMQPVYALSGSVKELAFLEQNMFSRLDKIYHDQVNHIHITETMNSRDEIVFLADSIVSLLEKGIPYKDICVCLRTLDDRERDIKEIFRGYGIPCYLNSEDTLGNHCVFRYGTGLFRLVVEKASFQSVFSLLKSGFFPIDDSLCDELENYCLAHAIKGYRFYQEKDWTWENPHSNENPQKMDSLRRDIMGILKPYAEAIGKKGTCRDYASLFWKFISQCNCGSKVAQWCEMDNDNDSIGHKTFLTSGLRLITDVLNELVATFDKRIFTAEEFLDLLTLAGESVKVRTIPNEADVVELQVLGKSYVSPKPYVFLAGLQEGIFPAAPEEGGFFNLKDREILKAYDSNWLKNKDFCYKEEDRLGYKAITMATEELWLSCSLKNNEGRAYPSPYFDTIRRLFPELVTEKYDEAALKRGMFSGGDEVLRNIGLEMRKEKHILWDSVKDMLRLNQNYANRLEMILSSLNYAPGSVNLSPAALDIYPGKNFSLSVSALETYGRCPFYYFVKYGLRIKERDILKFSAPDMGNLCHEVLCDFMEHMQSHNISWDYISETADDILENLVSDKLRKTGENLYPGEYLTMIGYLISDNLHLVLDEMAKRRKNGDCFQPYAWEIPFGNGEKIPGFELNMPETGQKATIRGVIDRIDTAEYNGSTYYRIGDYKAFGKKLSLDQLWHGIAPQLPVYLMAASPLFGNGVPAGMFYQSLEDAYATGFVGGDDDLQNDSVSEKMELSGYGIGEEVIPLYYEKTLGYKSRNKVYEKLISRKNYNKIQKHVINSITDMASGIASGCTEIRPYVREGKLSCQWCPCSGICGREKVIDGTESILLKYSDKDINKDIDKFFGEEDRK